MIQLNTALIGEELGIKGTIPTIYDKPFLSISI